MRKEEAARCGRGRSGCEFTPKWFPARKRKSQHGTGAIDLVRLIYVFWPHRIHSTLFHTTKAPLQSKGLPNLISYPDRGCKKKTETLTEEGQLKGASRAPGI